MNVILGYLFFFIAASASPLQRRWLASAKNHENKGQVRFAFQVMTIVSVLGLLIPFFQPAHIEGSPLSLIGLSVCAGIFGAGFFISSFVAQKHVDAGVTSLISNLYTPVTIILASLLLGEGLMPMQAFGTMLLLAGVLIVSKKHRTGRFSFDRYFLLMALSGISLGICLTAERALQKMTGFSAGTLLSWWSQSAFLGLTTLAYREKGPYSAIDISVTGILRFLQSLSWVILIFVVGNLSIVSSITTFKVVIVFVFAALFLGERDDIRRKIIGSLVAVAGLLMMK
ncbi:MAG: EamA family transporter [Candidatus Moranbacteria bacterium]|nr:EamA family transporter [Candidatus Moranbacteria bacterium]NTW45752.1 EamA family transporter [Candidatus Moranbacteria bacterium]